MASPPVLPLVLGRFKQLPQRSAEVWQGGVVRLPMWIAHPTDPDGPPSRPSGVLWVSLRTGLIHLVLPEEGEAPSHDLALSALIEFGLKWAKRLEGRPARVEVRDPALRDALAGPLAQLATAVTVVEEMPALREVLGNLEAEATGGVRIPGLLDSEGVTLDHAHAFAEAAAAFFGARPWRHLANEDLIVIDGPSAPKTMRHACVLGQGGQEFGIAFFDSRRAFEQLLESAETGRRPTRAHGATFGAIDELPFGDVDAWLDHDLPVAGPRAYPLLADLRAMGSAGPTCGSWRTPRRSCARWPPPPRTSSTPGVGRSACLGRMASSS